MDELFNTKAFEANLKEDIDERFNRMLLPVSPKKAEKQADNKLVKIEEAAQFTGYRVKYIYNLVNQKAIPFVRVRAIRYALTSTS